MSSDEISELRVRLEEAEAALLALREGGADAMIGDAGVIGLAGAEKPYQAFFEAMNEGGLTLACDGRILHCNPRFSEMLGLPVEALRGRLFQDFSDPGAATQIAELIANESFGTCETTLATHAGVRLPVQLSFRPMPLDGQRLVCLVVTDLSEHARAKQVMLETHEQLRQSRQQLQQLLSQRELALKESEAFNLAILNSVAAEIAVVDRDGKILAVNEPWRRFALENGSDPGKRAPNTEVGANYLAACQLDDAATAQGARQARDGIQAVLDGQLATFSMEYPCDSPERKRWFIMNVIPLGMAENNCVVVTHTNITRIKQAEEQTRQLLAENETILNNALVGIVYLKQRRIVSCNRRFEEIFQYEPGELIGESTERLYDTHETFLALGGRTYEVLGEGKNYSQEVLLRHKDGSLFLGAFNGSAIDPAHPNDGSIWIYSDISERQRIEAESLKLLQAVEQSPITIVITNRDGNIEYVNPSFSRVTGYSRDEVIGQNPRILKSGHTPAETYRELWRTLFDGGIWRGAMRNRCKDGELIWEEMSISPVFNAARKITHFVAVKENVTERKRIEQQLEEHQTHLEFLVLQRTAELRDALEAAKQADRAKDEFLANITHELRTPLSAVIGMAGLARGISSEPRQRDYLDKITSAGKHLNRIINDLLDLSKIAAGHMAFENCAFSLRGLILRGNSVMSHRAAEKGLELVETIDAAVPDILRGDAVRLEQILLNLVANAIKFTESGRVDVRVNLHAREEQRVCLDIEVEDSGMGMRPEDLERLFKPFSQADATVSRKFGGTGLGLAISRQLAQMMDGDISVTSHSGRGSNFRVRVWLGLAEAGELPPVEEKEPEAEQVSYLGARVLVVDDQPFNRDVVQGLLAIVGITPQLAENGQEALAILQDSADTFDLVLMDIQMPVMDGLTATRALRSQTRHAELPIIAMTAHTMTHEKVKAVDAGMNDHIGKPFDEAGFYRVLRRWIPRSKQHLHTPVAASATTAGSDGMPFFLHGVDTQAGLSLLQGDEARYRHWLTEFEAQAPAALAQIRAALAAGEVASASMAAHTLKGRMGLLGMKELHGIAAALETAIDGAAPTDQLLLGLTQGVVAMCAEIRNVLGVSPNPSVAAAPLPKNLPPGLPPACVTRLRASLQAGDSDCDLLITDCLAELKGTAWELRLQQALHHAKNFDYAAALIQLTDTRQEPAEES